MLSPNVIQTIRAVMERALKAGLIEFKETAAFSAAAVSLEVEEKLFHAQQAERKQVVEVPPE